MTKNEILSLGGGQGVYRGLNKHLRRIHKDDKQRIKSCLSKKGFDTEFEADVAAAKLELRSYQCFYCPHWHLTSLFANPNIQSHHNY